MARVRNNKTILLSDNTAVNKIFYFVFDFIYSRIISHRRFYHRSRRQQFSDLICADFLSQILLVRQDDHMTSLTKNWEQALGLIRDDLNETAYDAWFSGLIPLRADEKQHILYIGAESNFVIEMLNKRYLQMLEGAVEIAFKDTYKVSLQMETKDKVEEPKPEKAITKSLLDEEYYLNPRFSFENFVQGKNNEFAYSAAYAVAQAPAKQYNPLFLYGGSGLGKTHLMHGVGASVVNALSTKMVVEIQRNGHIYEQEYARGKTQTELKIIGDAHRTGSKTTFWPDPEIFEDIEYDFSTLEMRLREMAFLNKGIKITLEDKRPGKKKKEIFHYEGGLKEFVAFQNEAKEPIHPDIIYFEARGKEKDGKGDMEWPRSSKKMISRRLMRKSPKKVTGTTAANRSQ